MKRRTLPRGWLIRLVWEKLYEFKTKKGNQKMGNSSTLGTVVYPKILVPIEDAYTWLVPLYLYMYEEAESIIGKDALVSFIVVFS